jgi:hypothetical protein
MEKVAGLSIDAKASGQVVVQQWVSGYAPHLLFLPKHFQIPLYKESTDEYLRKQ